MATVVNLIILTLLGRVQEILSPLGAIKPMWILNAVAAIALFVAWPYRKTRRRWRRPTLFWLLASLGFVASVPMSLYPGQSLAFLATTYLCTAMLFLLVSQGVRKFSTLESISLGLVAMSLLHGAAMWIAPQALKTELGVRYSVSDAYDPNDLAVVYAMEVPFLFYWFWRGGAFLKSLSVVATVLAVSGIHWTGSRGGLVALGVVGGYLVFCVRELGPWIRGLLIVGMLAGGAAATQTETFHQLLLAVQGKDYNTTEEDGRLQIWRRGVGYAATHPVSGVGVMCFDVAEGQLSGRSASVRGVKWSAAHNSYIQILAENGVVAFLCWLAMIVASFQELNRQRRLLGPWRGERGVHRMLVFSAMVRAALLSYAVGAFFLSLGYLAFLYLLVAMTVSLAEVVDGVYDERTQAEGEVDDLHETDAAASADLAASTPPARA
jgi:O-antigen ligase